jgi:hypothetical protein
MLKSSQFTRSAVIAATLMSVGAGPALARPADVPLRPKPAVATVTRDARQWTQARVDGMGVRPAAASPAPAVPLTRATDPSGHSDRLLVAIAASTMLAALLAIAIVRTSRHRVLRVRARRV